MADHRFLTVAVVALLVTTACLLYLDWTGWHELELLNGRVNELEAFRRRRDAKPEPRPRTPRVTKPASEETA